MQVFTAAVGVGRRAKGSLIYIAIPGFAVLWQCYGIVAQRGLDANFQIIFLPFLLFSIFLRQHEGKGTQILKTFGVTLKSAWRLLVTALCNRVYASESKANTLYPTLHVQTSSSFFGFSQPKEIIYKSAVRSFSRF